MRAEFSNPVHLHCSLLEIYLYSLSTVYTPTSDGSREASYFPNSTDLTRAPTFGLGRLDSARLDFPTTVSRLRRILKVFDVRYLLYFVFLFKSLIAITHDNSIIIKTCVVRNRSIRHIPYKNSITEMKNSRRVTNPVRAES